MRTIYTSRHLKSFPITLVVFSAILFVGCSGYQSVSYYQDGIYDAAVEPQVTYQPAQAPTNPSGTYYKNYFSEKAAQGVQDDYIFTDAEEYQDATPDQASDGNYQSHGSWDDQADRINVNIIYNRPSNWSFGWYDAPFNYGRSSFWGYNYHPWYFTNYHYHNAYYNPYYNPYRNRWGYNNWYNRPYYGGDYYGGSSYYRSPVRYSRLRGPRSVNQQQFSGSRTLRGSDSFRTLNKRSITTRRSQTTTQPNTQTQRNATTQRSTTTTKQTSTAPSRTTARKQRENTTERAPRTYSNESSSSDNTSRSRPSSSNNNSYRRSSSSSRSSGTSSSRRSSSSSSSRRR